MSQTSPLKCLIVDLDFFIRKNSKGEEEPVIRIHGKTVDRKPINIQITGFYPYFYIDDIPSTLNTLQGLLFNEPDFEKWIEGSHKTSKKLYDQNKPVFLYKILGRNPWLIQKYSRILKSKGIKSYEKDISYISRFLIDTDIYGLNWVELQNYSEVENLSDIRTVEIDYQDINQTTDESYNYVVMGLNLVINSFTEEGRRIMNFSSILKEGISRIISMSICWGDGQCKTKTKVFYIDKNSDEAERKLIENIWETIHSISPDVLVTFSGNHVLFPYLIKRMEQLEMSTTIFSPLEKARIKLPIRYLGYRIPGYMVYDLVKSSRWIRTKTGKKGFSVYVSELLHTERKGEQSVINQIWFDSILKKETSLPKKFNKIASHDASLIHALFYEFAMEEWLEVMKLVGIRPSEGIYSTPRHLGEFQLFRILFQNRTLIPPDPPREIVVKRKQNRSYAVGGYVLVPQGTLHEAVLIADFTSMFPSVIIANNIGGESYKGFSKDFSDMFRKEPDTGLKLMEKKLLDQRKIIKKQIYKMETYLRSFPNTTKTDELTDKLDKLKKRAGAYKIVMNSVYGSHNYIASRFHNLEISNAITGIAKDYILKISNWTRVFSGDKCQVIYGDTDSVFIKLSDRKTVFEAYNRALMTGAFDLGEVPEVSQLLAYFDEKLPDEMNLEFVDLALRIVFAPETKKRYSYYSALTKELKIVGFEAIRSDTSPFAKKTQKLALKYLLEKGDVEQAKEKVIKKCLDFKNTKGEELIEQTIIYGPIRRNPKDYKSKTSAIGALEHFASNYGENIDILWKEYNRFPFVIARGDSALYKRSRHPTLITPEEVDVNHYINEALRDVNRIGLQIEMKDIKPPSQKTLDFILKK